MDIGGRKILPRIRPSSSGKQEVELAVEPAQPNEEGVGGVNGKEGQYEINLKQWRPAYDDPGLKRKRPNPGDGRAANAILPGVQQLLTVPTDLNALESQMASPARLVRHPQNGFYYSHGAFLFQAPAPPSGRDFPPELSQDARALSFARVEPELMDIFKHTWYLRQYIRQRRAQGIDNWWDHIMINDSYGIMNTLQTWSSHYEPGTVYYPASMLYKNVLWLYFNRSLQPSMATAGYRQVVDDGMHYLRELEQLLGNADRSFLLVPIFLLAASAFERRQRGLIFRSLEAAVGQHSGHHLAIFTHAMSVVERIWNMMSEGQTAESWDWERLQDLSKAQEVLNVGVDRSLVELLRDPFMLEYRIPRVRSPEAMQEFDQSRFRGTGNPPSAMEAGPNTRTSSGDTGRPSPSQGMSPTDAGRPSIAVDPSQSQHPGFPQERAPSLHDFPPVRPRPFIAPPPSGTSSLQHNAELMALSRSRIVKAKSMQPPCPVCGKELKNPSDASKHHLQHSKPFLCQEPGCTRILGFATENDLQRHRKSVHGASPRIGNKIGYVCTQCPDPSDGTQRKWWPRLDNFKAHIRRKHHGANEEALIQDSATPRRPEDTFTDSGFYPGSDYAQGQYATPDRQHQLSITSQASDIIDRDSEESAREGHVQRARQRAERTRDGDEEEDEGDDGEGEEDDGDGPVGPWELSRSFTANGKRRRLSPPEDEEAEEDEEEQEEAISPGTERRTRSQSKDDEEGDSETPRASAVDGVSAKVEQIVEDEELDGKGEGREGEEPMDVDVDGAEDGAGDEKSADTAENGGR